MAAVNTNENSLSAERAKTPSERIGILEERSRHAVTKAELHRALLWLYVAVLTTVGGLVIHLHNTALNEMSEIRQLLIDIMQRLPGS